MMISMSRKLAAQAVFGPDAVTIMGQAYDVVRDELMELGCVEPSDVEIASRVIGIAREGVLQPADIRACVLELYDLNKS